MVPFVEQMNNGDQFVNELPPFGEEFDLARRRLIDSDIVDERVAAVRALGEFKTDLSTTHLVAALFDTDANVRQAAVEALNQLGDPGISSECLEVMFAPALVAEQPCPHNESFAAQIAVDGVSQQAALSVIEMKFDDPSPEIRNAAIIALRDLDPDRPMSVLEQVLESSSSDRRERIIEAIEDSGLAGQEIERLIGSEPRRAQVSLSLLFLMAKLQIVQPFIEAIEHHDSPAIRRALIKVLTSTGHGPLAEAAAQRRLGIERNTPEFYAYR